MLCLWIREQSPVLPSFFISLSLSLQWDESLTWIVEHWSVWLVRAVNCITKQMERANQLVSLLSLPSSLHFSLPCSCLLIIIFILNVISSKTYSDICDICFPYQLLIFIWVILEPSSCRPPSAAWYRRQKRRLVLETTGARLSRNKFYVIAPLAGWAILVKLLKPYVPRFPSLVNECYYLSPGLVLRSVFRNAIKVYK